MTIASDNVIYSIIRRMCRLHYLTSIVIRRGNFHFQAMKMNIILIISNIFGKCPYGFVHNAAISIIRTCDESTKFHTDSFLDCDGGHSSSIAVCLETCTSIKL